MRADSKSWRERDSARSGWDLPSREHEAFLSHEMRGPAETRTGHGASRWPGDGAGGWGEGPSLAISAMFFFKNFLMHFGFLSR